MSPIYRFSFDLPFLLTGAAATQHPFERRLPTAFPSLPYCLLVIPLSVVGMTGFVFFLTNDRDGLKIVADTIYQTQF